MTHDQVQPLGTSHGGLPLYCSTQSCPCVMSILKLILPGLHAKHSVHGSEARLIQNGELFGILTQAQARPNYACASSCCKTRLLFLPTMRRDRYALPKISHKMKSEH